MLFKYVYFLLSVAVIGWWYTWLCYVNHEYLNPVAEARYYLNRAVCKVREKYYGKRMIENLVRQDVSTGTYLIKTVFAKPHWQRSVQC